MSDTLVPKIIDYVDGRVMITIEAMSIPETRAIIDKHGDELAERYLAYVQLLSSPTSPYINENEDEASDNAAADINSTFGEFDPEDELLKPAIERLKKFYVTPIVAFYTEIQQEIHRQRQWLRDNPITEGKEGNIAVRQRFIEKVGTTINSYKIAEKQAEEELKTKMRGKSALGDY